MRGLDRRSRLVDRASGRRGQTEQPARCQAGRKVQPEAITIGLS